MDILRQHEIAEAGHRMLNPFTDDKLMLLGSLCRLGPGQRQLDLACGKGEMLCRWAEAFGIAGHGVDISEVFLPLARQRAEELGVAGRVTFELGDAAAAVPADGSYDVVSCIGATWIGADPDAPDAPAMRAYLHASRHGHLRRYLGWGVFVL